MDKKKDGAKDVGEKEEKMVRTSAGLRNVLFDEIDDLRNGASNPARARSLAMLANTVLSSVEVEIEFHKYVSDVSKFKGGAQIGVLELGTKQIALSGPATETS